MLANGEEAGAADEVLELFEEAGHTFSKMGIGVSAPKLDLKAMMAFKDQGVDGNVKGVDFLL